MLAAIGGSMFSETFNSIKNATRDRRPITLANGHKTTDYQVWRIAFGQKEKGVERYVVNTNPIILKELTDDRAGLVIYKKLLEVSPERLYPPDYYYLEYRLPKSPFTIRVKIDHIDEVKRCYHELSKLEHKKLLHLAESSLDGLKLVPRIEGQPVFNFEPEDLVTVPGNELKTTAALTAFLSDLYLAGRISATQYDAVMHLPSSEMRKETFTLIPPREQPKHEYLLKPSKPRKPLENEDKYHLGHVTLKEYAALKRPDLAHLDKRLAIEWPRPERTFICVVCGEDTATIKCIECDNRCCRECVRREFSEHINNEAGEYIPPTPPPPPSSSLSSSSSSSSSTSTITQNKLPLINSSNQSLEKQHKKARQSLKKDKDKNNKQNSSNKSDISEVNTLVSDTVSSSLVMKGDKSSSSSKKSSSSTTSSQQQLHHQQSFLLIHQVYCLRNGRISRDFLRGLHHYENRIKSHTKHHKKKTHSKH